MQLADAYARVTDGEMWLEGVHIAPYAFARGFGAHDPDRPRKLLLHGDEIGRLRARVAQERLTLVPLAIYFKDGRAKVELALARGRKQGRPPRRPSPSATPSGRRPGRSGASAKAWSRPAGRPVCWLVRNVNGADRVRHQFRRPSVRPELLRLVKRGTTTTAEKQEFALAA